MVAASLLQMLLATANFVTNGNDIREIAGELLRNERSSNDLVQNELEKNLTSLNVTTGNTVTYVPQVLCTSFVISYGENEIRVSLAPRGSCLHCCRIRINDDIRFLLFNKEHKEVRLPLEEEGALSRLGLDNSTQTVFFIHGFSETSPGPSGRYIIDAYTSLEEPVNVILVDWSEIATMPWYNDAVSNTMLTAKVLARFLEFYDETGELPISNVHLIGFSLGSHIAGCAAKRLRRGLKIPRITGLDPAFPLYSPKSKNRLSRDDAEYVDVIHTDGGILGFPFPLGHVDFFPNRGVALQPGCEPQLRSIFSQRLVDQVLACSHVRAWRLYSESVRNPRAFPATKCKDWLEENSDCDFTLDAFMGYACNSSSEGSYYLVTNDQQPFAKSMREQRALKSRRSL